MEKISLRAKNLIVQYNDFVNSNPVYPFELPAYLEEFGTSVEDYFQRGMTQAQILIDAFCQNFLLDLEWKIDTFSEKMQQQIMDILIAQFIFMHENQSFFQKTNDIQYSSAGQQTFTYSPESSEGNFSLIPDNVKIMIQNLGVIRNVGNLKESDTAFSQYDNEFLDGIFVPEVKWSDKADYFLPIDGENVPMWQILMNINSNYISKLSTDWQNFLTFHNKFMFAGNKIISTALLSSTTVFPNKINEDYAQVKDVIDTYNAISLNVQNNTSAITGIVSGMHQLNNLKVNLTQYNSEMASKANSNLNNVNVGNYPIPRYFIIDTNGQLQLTTVSGNNTIRQWSDVVEYVEGEQVFVWRPDNLSNIWIRNNKLNGKGEKPQNISEYWQKTQLVIDLNSYARIDYVNNSFVNKNMPAIYHNLEANGFNIMNSGNLLEKSDLNDQVTSNDSLWSSEKVLHEIQKSNESAKTIAIFQPWEIKQNLQANPSIFNENFFNVNILKTYDDWNTLFEQLKMDPNEINLFKIQSPFNLDNLAPKAIFDILQNKYLRTGENASSIGGSNLLKQTDLPDLKFWFSIRYNVIGYTNTAKEGNQSKSKFYYNDMSPDISEYGPQVECNWNGAALKFVKVGFNLNGGVPQTEFTPEYVVINLLICYRTVEIKVVEN